MVPSARLRPSFNPSDGVVGRRIGWAFVGPRAVDQTRQETCSCVACSGIGVNDKTLETFQCYVCNRVFRWNPEISGKTIECKCGAKVRCPELHDNTMTAGESLDDTVADVVLDEVLDDFQPGQAEHIDEGEAIHLRNVARRRGVFGLSLGGEVVFFSITSLIGLAFTFLCLATLIWKTENMKNFWPYLVVAVIVGPISWKILANRWRIYSQGRSVPHVIADLFGDEAPDN